MGVGSGFTPSLPRIGPPECAVSWPDPLCTKGKEAPRQAGGFPGNRSALQSMSGDPLLGLKGDIHERLEVVETK